ncbi:pyridoxamine 5'-phosphate oxidase family protein [Streptomyces alkaliphilus]|uniref:pyridoxamine 5'-phosphate oxidase family protein n=1 Tax=Streptomyces alkaliphilus TaxID=1472722 RepID=UPI001564A480|nr:pyridoxamine 5'-phosphate oxidase family protein [Streptomyces alkaliphilus]
MAASSPVPVTTEPYLPGAEGAPVAWADALAALAGADWCWLSTTSRDGAPHTVPILAVVTGGLPHFATGAGTRKTAHLGVEPRCVLAAQTPELHLVIEGVAERVGDDAMLESACVAYLDRHGWETEVRDGALHAPEGAPTAGPPPYPVYRLSPTRAFAFPAGVGHVPTRWRF